jgi:hypothetical protein
MLGYFRKPEERKIVFKEMHSQSPELESILAHSAKEQAGINGTKRISKRRSHAPCEAHVKGSRVFHVRWQLIL